MSISAISSDFSTYQNYLYQYFGSSISESKFDSLMSKYGISESGDASKDVQSLYSAMSSDANTEAAGSVAAINEKQQANQSTQETQALSANNVPWATLMSQVGLTATGVLNTDYQNFNDKLSQMQTSAASSSQTQAYISQLSAQASVVFVDNSSASQSTQAQSNKVQVSGSDIVAQLNRLLMLG